MPKLEQNTYAEGDNTFLQATSLTECWTLVYYAVLFIEITSKITAIRVFGQKLVWLCIPIWNINRRLIEYRWLIIIAIYGGYVTILVIKKTDAFWYFLPYYPLLAIFLVGVFPFFIMMFTSMRSFTHIYQVYFHATSSPSHSCFFMPCAPQKIGENDQAYSLFSRPFSLVVIEVLVLWVVRRLRK